MRAHPGEEVAFCGSTPAQNVIPKAVGKKGGGDLGVSYPQSTTSGLF